MRLRDLVPTLPDVPGFAEAYAANFPYAQEALAVARLRGRFGLTQAELARRIGTTQSVIARLESGRHPVEIRLLHRVADALDVPLRVAFGDDARQESRQVAEEHVTYSTPALDDSRPGDSDPLLAAFNAANTSRDFKTAATIAGEIEDDPSTPRRRVALALVAFNDGRDEDATRWASSALADELPDRSRETASIVLASALLRQGKARAAIRVVSDYADGPEPSWLAVAATAEAQMELGWHNKAWASANRALALSDNQPEARYVVARVAWHQGRLLDALEHVAVFRAAYPNDRSGILLHGSVLGYLGDANSDPHAHEAALTLFRPLASGGDAEATRLAAVTAGRLGHWRAAFDYAGRLRRSAKRLPAGLAAKVEGNVTDIVEETLRTLADSHSDALGRAVSVAEKRFGASRVIRLIRASERASQGDVSDVLASLGWDEEAVGQAPRPEQLLVAMAYQQAGQSKKSLAILKRLRDLVYDDEGATRLAGTAIDAGDHALAEEILSDLAEREGAVAELASVARRLLSARDARHEVEVRVLQRWTAELGASPARPPSPTDSSWEGPHKRTSQVLDVLAGARAMQLRH